MTVNCVNLMLNAWKSAALLIFSNGITAVIIEIGYQNGNWSDQSELIVYILSQTWLSAVLEGNSDVIFLHCSGEPAHKRLLIVIVIPTSPKDVQMRLEAKESCHKVPKLHNKISAVWNDGRWPLNYVSNQCRLYSSCHGTYCEIPFAERYGGKWLCKLHFFVIDLSVCRSFLQVLYSHPSIEH